MVVDAIDLARNAITKANGSHIADFKIAPLISENEVREAESSLNVGLPNGFRRMLIDEMGGGMFSWSRGLGPNTDPRLRRGHLHIVNVQEMVQLTFDIRGQAMEVETESLIGEGYSAMVTDWPFWVPFCTFPNGDCFCFDSRSTGDSPVFFLEHDVMDGGPNLHGLQIAPNFSELIKRWSSIAFLDVYDWSTVVSGDGLDVAWEWLRDFRREIGL